MNSHKVDTVIDKNIGRVTVEVELVLDVHPDVSWMGEYANDPGPYAIETGRNGRYFQYFNPPYQNYAGCDEDEIVKYCRQDFERMEAYNRGEWKMVGVVAHVYIDQVKIVTESVWGVEYEYSIEGYHRELARDMVKGALHGARQFVQSLQKERLAEDGFIKVDTGS